jgi:hypothetical protein
VTQPPNLPDEQRNLPLQEKLNVDAVSASGLMPRSTHLRAQPFTQAKYVSPTLSCSGLMYSAVGWSILASDFNSILGGQGKTGHLSTLQNRPFPVSATEAD